MNDLAVQIYVPDPYTIVPAGYASQVRIAVTAINDIEHIDAGRRRMAAIEAYVRDRQQRNEAQAAQRWCEARIGELLGPALVGSHSSALEGGGLSGDERYWFRRLADHLDIVEAAIADGRTSRAAVLKLIDLHYISRRESKDANGEYDVIVIDPPWPMAKIERDVAPNQAEFDYPTMSLDDIKALRMPAAQNCHLWLWTTHKFLPDAFDVLGEWKFDYVCTFVWHKPGGFQPFGLPQYNCEFALYARRGTPVFIETSAFPVCFNAPRGAHSEKPDVFYDMVRRTTVGLRIDYYNRRQIDGFHVYGNEAHQC